MKQRNKVIIIGVVIPLFYVASALASESLMTLLKKQISTAYPNSSVDLFEPVQWVRGTPSTEIVSLNYLGDDGRGNAHFIAKNSEGQDAEGWMGFNAWVTAKIATKRIHPGEALIANLFNTQKVDISKGIGKEYRGVILSDSTEVNGLESIQTILEGQFLISSAVQRVPDVRRGDPVSIHLISGGLTLSTQGVAEEPGYISNTIRVQSRTGKRELIGKLQTGRVVEVIL